MGRLTDVKSGIRLAKKLKFRKPLTIDEFKFFKKEGLIKGTPGKISKTKKGTEFVKRISKLKLI